MLHIALKELASKRLAAAKRKYQEAAVSLLPAVHSAWRSSMDALGKTLPLPSPAPAGVVASDMGAGRGVMPRTPRWARLSSC